jgi:hypothetical protein
VFDTWFRDTPRHLGPPLPRSWIRAGTWTVLRQANLGGRTVSFYAVTPGELPKLKAALAEYAASLPSDVTPSEE